MEVYNCKFCLEFHLGHPKNGERPRQTNPVSYQTAN